VLALIDWDNVEEQERRKGPRFVTEKIWHAMNAIAPAVASAIPELNVRIYGGWYGGNPDAGPADNRFDLLSALRERLGLELQTRNVRVDLLVMDHIEQTPSSN